MKADSHSALLGSSLAFAAAAMLGSVVAIRDQLPGEPLGVNIPLSVPCARVWPAPRSAWGVSPAPLSSR